MAGDQNAMSMMILVGENARAGNPVAQKSYHVMRNYLNAGHEPTAYQPYNMGHEPTAYQPYNMGAEDALSHMLHIGVDHGWGKAVALANGPLLHDLKVADVGACFGADDDFHDFISGVVHPSHPAVSDAHQHGKVIGMARKIQAVRMPGSRISDYSPTVGWELGE
jgi:hypothetical protein